jgi:uncharacterized protein DUF2334
LNRINISIDDISPHPRSSTRVLKQCFRVIEKFPDVKFTLFIPIAYWRTQGVTATSTELSIDAFPAFCDELKALPKKNFELAYHGLNHGIPGRSNNDELQNIDLDEARGIIGRMKAIVTKAGLIDEFKGILRPPAWRMSPDAFQACLEAGITTFALSPDDYALSTYGGIEKNVRAVFFNVAPPFRPLAAFLSTEVVYHACEWDKNYLSDQLTDELLKFLEQNRFEFVFLEGLLDG